MTTAPASGTLPRRVARLPRNSSKRRSGLTHASCARLLGAPVATCAPGPRSASARPTSASLGSALVGTATIASSPEPKLDGRSLAECTARSARPSISACSTSFTKAPWPPIAPMGRSLCRSPTVSTTTSSVAIRGVAALEAAEASASATSPAWRSARGLPRLALRSVSTSRLQVEQAAQRLGEPFAARRAGRVLDPHRRLVEELGDGATGDRVDDLTSFGPERIEPRPLALELGATNRLGPHPQRRHDRGRGPGRGRGPIALELLGQNSSDRRDLSAARRHLSLRKSPHVLHVEQTDPFEVGHGRVDVTGDGDVDHQQGPPGA